MKGSWSPTTIWQGQPCYVIGGGPSLRGFEWEALKGRNVIGCNAAYLLGAQVVPWLIFGDASFLHQHKEPLKQYVADGGTVVTNCSRVRKPPLPSWVHNLKKEIHGLSKDGLGWNGNTGASAINLALLFGANPVYLLGFDMQLSPDGKGNYHNAYHKPPKADVYDRFIKGMKYITRDLPKMFPGSRIINLEDGTSAMEVFPKESLRAHFSPVEVGGEK